MFTSSHSALSHFLGLGKWRVWLSCMRKSDPSPTGAGWWAGREGVSRAEWRAQRRGRLHTDSAVRTGALCWTSTRRAHWLDPLLLSLLPGGHKALTARVFPLAVDISVSLVVMQYFASHCATRGGFLQVFPQSISISEWIACYFNICSVGSRPDNFSVFCSSSKSGCT